jgi:hypothetical protein
MYKDAADFMKLEQWDPWAHPAKVRDYPIVPPMGFHLKDPCTGILNHCVSYRPKSDRRLLLLI